MKYPIIWLNIVSRCVCEGVFGWDSTVPGILQARTLEWVAISFSITWKWKVKVKSLSRVWLFATPWTAAHQPPPSMGFSRQEYWSGVPLPSPSFMSPPPRNSYIEAIIPNMMIFGGGAFGIWVGILCEGVRKKRDQCFLFLCPWGHSEQVAICITFSYTIRAILIHGWQVVWGGLLSAGVRHLSSVQWCVSCPSAVSCDERSGR